MRTMPKPPFAEPKHGHSNLDCCALCGKPIGSRRWYIHVIDGGRNILHPADEALYPANDPGDMYCFLVGPECRKRLGEFCSAPLAANTIRHDYEDDYADRAEWKARR